MERSHPIVIVCPVYVICHQYLYHYCSVLVVFRNEFQCDLHQQKCLFHNRTKMKYNTLSKGKQRTKIDAVLITFVVFISICKCKSMMCEFYSYLSVRNFITWCSLNCSKYRV